MNTETWVTVHYMTAGKKSWFSVVNEVKFLIRNRFLMNVNIYQMV